MYHILHVSYSPCSLFLMILISHSVIFYLLYFSCSLFSMLLISHALDFPGSLFLMLFISHFFISHTKHFPYFFLLLFISLTVYLFSYVCTEDPQRLHHSFSGFWPTQSISLNQLNLKLKYSLILFMQVSLFRRSAKTSRTAWQMPRRRRRSASPVSGLYAASPEKPSPSSRTAAILIRAMHRGRSLHWRQVGLAA